MGSGEKLYSCGTRYSTCYRTHAHVSRSHRGSLQQCLKSFAGSSTITGFACLIYIKIATFTWHPVAPQVQCYHRQLAQDGFACDLSAPDGVAWMQFRASCQMSFLRSRTSG